ncbi:PadR family transcriptional regulator [Clostridium oceanicum]|uniref:PadR family transcriptional regulator n=1 Tax=Clostridium oceanicum TaxID=1543 RepID=A0ABN1JG71_9CLOT
MKEKILRRVFLGFIQIHILYHAKKDPIYGSWMIEELKNHGYKASPGLIYPMLSKMEKEGLLFRSNKNINGRIRKFYSITELGEEVLKEAYVKAESLFGEIHE